MKKQVTPSDSRSLLLKWLRWFIGIVVLIAIAYWVDLQSFISRLAQLDTLGLLAMVGVSLLARCVRAWKWNLLLRTGGIHFGFWHALRLSLVAHFAGSWTPGQLGGDAYRILALRPFGKPLVVLSSVLLERYAGLCAVCFCSILYLPLTLRYIWAASPWLIGLIFLSMLFLLSCIPLVLNPAIAFGLKRFLPVGIADSLQQKGRLFLDSLREFRESPKAIGIFAFASLIEVNLYFVVNYLAARALGLDVSLVYFLVAMPLVHLLLRIPISFQAIGIQEGCFAYALVQHGFSASEGLAVSVVQRALEWVVAIVPGGLLLWLTDGPSPYDLMESEQQTAEPAVPAEDPASRPNPTVHEATWNALPR